MLCSLSGKAVVNPAVSPRSGRVFERSVLEAWVTEKGTDPISREPLSKSDLIELELTPANPSLTELTSIPALLAALQTEFNAVVIENFEISNENRELKEELKRAQEAKDAALRVITKLSEERSELRDALSILSEDQQSQPVKKRKVNPGEAADANSGVDSRSDENLLNISSLATTMSLARHDFAGTRDSLNRLRREYNRRNTAAVLPEITYVVDAGFTGSSLSTRRHLALVSKTTVVNIKSKEQLADLGNPSSWLDDEHFVVLGQRDVAITGIDGTLMSKLVVNGKPLHALVHPAGYILVSFATKIEFVAIYIDSDGVRMNLRKDLTLAIPKIVKWTLHPDGEFLVWAGTTKASVDQVIIYSLIEREEILSVQVDNPVSELAASPNGYHIACVSRNDVVLIDLRNDDDPVYVTFDSQPNSLSFDPTGQRLLVNCAEQVSVLVYDPSKNKWATKGLKVSMIYTGLSWYEHQPLGISE